MSHPLERQIGDTRRQARRLLLRYGLAWTLAIALSVALVLTLADFALRFEDRGIRLMCSLAAVGGLLAAAYRFAYRPLGRKMSNVEIAQSIERRFPQLGERLSSAIDFLGRQEDDPGAGSALLRRSVIHETEQVMADLPVDESLDRRPARCALAVAAAVMLVTLAIVAFAPRLAALAALRLAKPFGDDRWPRDNNLEFRAAPSRLAVGDSFEAELVDAGGLLPEEVRIYYRHETANGPSDSVEIAHPQGNRFTVQKKEVDRPFSFRAEGGDDHQMPWRSVDVIETPRVEALKVVVTPPAYTGWPAEPSDSRIQALRGSRLEFTGAATKPLKAIAWRQGDRVMAGVVADDRLGFHVPSPGNQLLVEGSGEYRFDLTDAEELVGGKGEHWEIQALVDAAPTVTIEEPAGNIFVTARASVPIKIVAKDDLALHEIALHSLESNHSDTGEVRTELYRGPERHPPAPTGAEAVGGERGDSRAVTYALELAPLDLKPGATLTFFASAADYMPQQGQSAPRKLTILSPREFEDRIAQRQSLIHGEIARALKVQQETRTQTGALEIQARDVGKLTKADLDRAQAAEMNQRQVKRMLAGERDGVRAGIKELFAELANNRVDSPDLKRQMQEMLEELARLGDEQLGPIERELTGAVKDARSELAQADASNEAERPAAENNDGDKQGAGKQDTTKQDTGKQSGDKQDRGRQEGDRAAGEKQPGPVARELANAGEHQERVIESLEAMLGRLGQWDNYRRFGREVAQLRQQQEDLLTSTREAAGKTLGKDLKDLDPQQQADLKKVAGRQTELARQLDKLEQQMSEARERLADEDPVASETLGDALDQARQRGQRRNAQGGRSRRAQSGVASRGIAKTNLARARRTAKHSLQSARARTRPTGAQAQGSGAEPRAVSQAASRTPQKDGRARQTTGARGSRSPGRAQKKNSNG